ncbi:hypothetical protein ACFLZG_01640 [Thermodesulfobacteriota bacterium]
MEKSREPIQCEKCGTEMVPIARERAFDDMPTTVSSTSPVSSVSDVSASQYDNKNSEERWFSEWVEYECLACSFKDVIKIS